MEADREIKEIPLEELDISASQVRVHGVGAEIDELANSIKKVGLLQPIVVCKTKDGRYDILSGQRRFLAHQRLKRKTILAVVLENNPDETQSKVISLTENLVREDLKLIDLIDACTDLYNKYGSVQAVVEATGISPNKVRQYVKFDRLAEPLKELVKEGEIPLASALRTQNAIDQLGEVSEEEIVEMGREMSGMSGAQQKAVIDEIVENPETSIPDVLENAKSGRKLTQVIVTLTTQVHSSLKKVAAEDGVNQDVAAATLIEEALAQRGLFADE